MALPKSKPSSSSAPPPTFHYQPLPSEVQPNTQAQNYVIILPHHHPTHRRHQRRRILLWATAILLTSAAIFLLWPSDPDLSVVRLHFDRLQIRTNPLPFLDITLDLIVKVRNRDLYSIDYDTMLVAIGYRGKQLGFATCDNGHVRGRGSSYLNATLTLDGVEVLSDVFILLEDLAKGFVPFDTVTEIRGQLGFFFFQIPLNAKVSCEVYVNTHNRTILRQNCHL